MKSLDVALAITGALAAGSTGCASLLGGLGVGTSGPAPAHVARPAGDPDLTPRYFPPPIALAVPEDAVVRVVGPTVTCSGTLVEPDLVLTAHHCVVQRGAHGEYLTSPIASKSLGIELGGDYLAWGGVGVKAVVAPPCGESGGAGDVAVLVLDHPLVGLGTWSVRLDEPPKVKEPVEAFGFGRCALSADGVHRKRRHGGAVRTLTGETIGVVAAICPGDSGGPVVRSDTREVVGVVSMSEMDADEETSGPSLMARVDAYRAVFAQARAIADGVAPNELPPLTCAP